jgi:hypothetical protein
MRIQSDNMAPFHRGLPSAEHRSRQNYDTRQEPGTPRLLRSSCPAHGRTYSPLRVGFENRARAPTPPYVPRALGKTDRLCVVWPIRPNRVLTFRPPKS